MCGEWEERGDVGEDAGEDQGVPSLVGENHLQQLNAFLKRKSLQEERDGRGRSFSNSHSMQ